MKRDGTQLDTQAMIRTVAVVQRRLLKFKPEALPEWRADIFSTAGYETAARPMGRAFPSWRMQQGASAWPPSFTLAEGAEVLDGPRAYGIPRRPKPGNHSGGYDDRHRLRQRNDRTEEEVVEFKMVSFPRRHRKFVTWVRLEPMRIKGKGNGPHEGRDGLKAMRSQLRELELDVSVSASQLEDPAWLVDAMRNVETEIEVQLVKLARFQSRLAALREARRTLKKVADTQLTGGNVADRRQPQSPRDNRPAKPGRAGSLAAVIRAGVRVALESEGRPLTRTQLLQCLHQQGISVSSGDPARALGKVLWRSDDFEHRKDGYWFSSGMND